MSGHVVAMPRRMLRDLASAATPGSAWRDVGRWVKVRIAGPPPEPDRDTFVVICGRCPAHYWAAPSLVTLRRQLFIVEGWLRVAVWTGECRACETPHWL
jgi:hypothetical protein